MQNIKHDAAVQRVESFGAGTLKGRLLAPIRSTRINHDLAGQPIPPSSQLQHSAVKATSMASDAVASLNRPGTGVTHRLPQLEQ